MFTLRQDGVFKSGGNQHWSSTWYRGNGSSKGTLDFETLPRMSGIRLIYSKAWESGDRENFDYVINFTTTSCNYGGFRYWFICPLIVNGVPCRRRVAKLYAPWWGRYFGCRQCHNLSYESRQTRHYSDYESEMRLARSIAKLREMGF